jgi:hypothetical protein
VEPLPISPGSPQNLRFFNPETLELQAPQEYFTSYSGLVKAQGKKALTPQEDLEDEESSAGVITEPILPRGPKFGDFWISSFSS